MGRWRMFVLGPAALFFALGITALLCGTAGAAQEAKVGSGPGSQSKESVWKYDYFDNFYDVASVKGQDIWVVGNNSRILHSSDNGKTWVIQTAPTKETLFSVSFVDARRGWASGANGVILHTADGGTTWVRQATGTSHPIFRIQFLSENVGFACGYFGTFLRTADGGKTWQNKSVGEDVTLRGMSFVDEKTGFIVGEFGTILKTVDSGSTFSRPASPVPLTLFAVNFSNGNSGFATGIDGALIATSDGGKTWRKEESGTKDHLIGVRSDGRISVAVGLRGTVIAKKAGGGWAPVDAKTLNWLSGVFLGEDRKGYAVGAHGTILRLEDILDKGRGN
jgi:photosystem II stability/assembly factor-like uncharacterized protein